MLWWKQFLAKQLATPVLQHAPLCPLVWTKVSLHKDAISKHNIKMYMTWRWTGQLHIPATLSWRTSPHYPLNWSLSGPHPQWYLCRTTWHHIWQDSNVQDHSTSHEMGTTALRDRYTCTAESSNNNIKHYNNTLTWRSWLQLYQVAQVTWPWDERPAVLNWNKHWSWINGTRDM